MRKLLPLLLLLTACETPVTPQPSPSPSTTPSPTTAPLVSPSPSASPSPTATPSVTPSPLASHIHWPVYIDKTKIPAAREGAAIKKIRATTELPATPSDGVGAFRTVCKYSHMNFDDPIVYPNNPGASHLHMYTGNTDAQASSTAESIQNSGASTCRGGIANRSAYWVPALIDAAGVPQAPIEMHVYYKRGYYGLASADITTFPRGLKMVSGNMRASSKQEVAYWTCLDNGGVASGSIPLNCRPGEPLEQVIKFPQCWDGKNLDSADHKSHMSFPVAGKCPGTHPVGIPAIEYHVRYALPDAGTKGWHLSSDMYDLTMPGGFSGHGDWFEGWDPVVANTFVTGCIRAGKDCHSNLLSDGTEIF